MQNSFIKGFTQIGASHIRQNKPNQDSVGTLSLLNNTVHILAVSDGHGSERYFRSEIGSQLAVKAARHICEQFFEPIPTLSEIKSLLDILARKLVFKWREDVQAHWEKFPFSESEKVLLKNPEKIEHAYGATLLIAVITPKYAIYLQLGDGDISIINYEQHLCTPIIPDQGLIGTETHSLCEANAETYWRITSMAFNEPPRLVILSTDGYSNSYANQTSFLNMINELYQGICEYGLGVVLDELPKWLKETTNQGCGDDISVALFCRESCKPDSEMIRSQQLSPQHQPHLVNVGKPEDFDTLNKTQKGRVLFTVGKSIAQDLCQSLISTIQKRFL